jgi:hypothetical protein
MNRKTVPGRDSAAPSWSAPVANRITATESLTKTACNGLLQQNRSKADMARSNRDVGFTPESRHCGSQLTCPLCAKTGSQFGGDQSIREATEPLQ